MVLFVKISFWSIVAIVPVVGNVISVVAVDLIVVANAPSVIKAPPNVIVLVASFATPVPPFNGEITPVICPPPMDPPVISDSVANVPLRGNVKSVLPNVLNLVV